MTKDQFDSRLRELAILVGKYETMDQFTESYEKLFNEIKEDSPRYERALRLRTLADHQLQFLMNQWVTEDRKQWAPGWVR
jgi:hypothetical protein